MLELEIVETPPRKRRFSRRWRSGYLEIVVVGDTHGLTELQGKAAEAAARGEARLDAVSASGRATLRLLLAAGGLQAVGLADGLLLAGDADALADISRAAGYCLANAASPHPLDGYHHHLELHDELGRAAQEPIGEITVVWRAG